MGYRLTQRGHQPAVQAATADLRLYGQLGMKVGRQSQGNASGVRLVRLMAGFGATLKIKIHSLFKGFADFFHRIAVKSDNIIDTDKPADKALVFGTEADEGRIAFVRHGVVCIAHGSIPNLVKNSLAFRT